MQTDSNNLSEDFSRALKPIQAIYMLSIFTYTIALAQLKPITFKSRHASPDLLQCIVYDDAGPNARLMGIEYVIIEKVFNSLPQDEKSYWHSHNAPTDPIESVC
ncbi:hypothetical protein ACEPAF_8207 [Sanghuangporus sanghuang]